MKKTLKELELNIPSINLLATRSIIGGYDIDPVEIIEIVDYGDEERSEREEDNFEGPNSNELYESREDQEQDQEQDQNSFDDTQSDTNNGDAESNNSPTVQVPNGDCVPGAIAAIIQLVKGGTASDALNKANDILKEVGATKGEDGAGTKISGEQMIEVMSKIVGGTIVTNPPASEMEGLFDSGCVALGFMYNSTHAVAVTDYDPTTGCLTYFDATDDHYGWFKEVGGFFNILVIGGKK